MVLKHSGSRQYTADKPKLAVAVMVVNAPGDGGTVAAPIARQILEAGL